MEGGKEGDRNPYASKSASGKHMKSVHFIHLYK